MDWLSLNHVPAYRQIDLGQEMNYRSYSILSPGSTLGSNQWYPGSGIIHLPRKLDYWRKSSSEKSGFQRNKLS